MPSAQLRIEGKGTELARLHTLPRVPEAIGGSGLAVGRRRRCSGGQGSRPAEDEGPSSGESPVVPLQLCQPISEPQPLQATPGVPPPRNVAASTGVTLPVQSLLLDRVTPSSRHTACHRVAHNREPKTSPRSSPRLSSPRLSSLRPTSGPSSARAPIQIQREKQVAPRATPTQGLWGQPLTLRTNIGQSGEAGEDTGRPKHQGFIIDLRLKPPVPTPSSMSPKQLERLRATLEDPESVPRQDSFVLKLTQNMAPNGSILGNQTESFGGGTAGTFTGSSFALESTSGLLDSFLNGDDPTSVQFGSLHTSSSVKTSRAGPGPASMASPSSSTTRTYTVKPTMRKSTLVGSGQMRTMIGTTGSIKIGGRRRRSDSPESFRKRSAMERMTQLHVRNELEARALIYAEEAQEREQMLLESVVSECLTMRSEVEREQEEEWDDFKVESERCFFGNFSIGSTSLADVFSGFSASTTVRRISIDVSRTTSVEEAEDYLSDHLQQNYMLDTLQDAILEGNRSQVKVLLKWFPAVINEFMQTVRGHLTPLMLAASVCQTKIAEVLLHNGAEVDIVGYGSTAIDFAIFSGSAEALEMVELLLTASPNLRRALGTATLAGRSDIMDLLVRAGAREAYNKRLYGGLLNRAVQSGQGDVVGKVLDWEMPCHDLLCRAIDQAARVGSTEVLKALLNYWKFKDAMKARFMMQRRNTLGRYYESCTTESYYQRAASHVNKDHRVLVAMKEKLEIHRTLNRCLLRAAQLRNTEMLQCCIHHLKDCIPLDEIRDSDGNTALHLAALHGRKEAVKILLHYIRPDICNRADQRPINLAPVEVRLLFDPNCLEVLEAVEEGNTTRLIRAIKNGKDINGADDQGRTPLMEACWQSDVTAVNLLLKAGARVHLTTRGGFNALLWAQWKMEGCTTQQGESLEIWLALQKSGLRPSAKNAEGLENLRRVSMSSAQAASLLGYRQHIPRRKSSLEYSLKLRDQHGLGDRMSLGVNLSQLRCIFPPQWRPEKTLEQWLASIDKDKYLPETNFENLVSEARWFVVNKVAEGLQDPPHYILALHLYTAESDLYRNCNRALREGKDMEIWRDFIFHLIQALNHIDAKDDSSKKPQLLFRGVSPASAVDLSVYTPSSTVIWPAFSSTTCTKDVAETFMRNKDTKKYDGVMFAIHGSSARSIKEYSFYSDEDEYLFLPNTHFKVKELHCMRWASSAFFHMLHTQGSWLQLSPEEAAKRQCLIIILEEYNDLQPKGSRRGSMARRMSLSMSLDHDPSSDFSLVPSTDFALVPSSPNFSSVPSDPMLLMP